LAAGYWGYLGLCDIPLRTYETAIDYIKTEIKPDIIFWTGDNPSHEFHLINQTESLVATKIITDSLKASFPNIPIFPVLGNHEKYPIDLFNTKEGAEKEFLSYFAELWKDWLNEDASAQFRKTGYYTQLLTPNSKDRVLVLNCMITDSLNFYIYGNNTDPLQQLKWMEEVLRFSEKNDERVFVVGHIPPGNSFFPSEYSKRYNALSDRFSNIIISHLYAHTHNDEFKIINDYFDESKIAGVVFAGPSLTS
jgi:sphingomyelin phosphodiesterase